MCALTCTAGVCSLRLRGYNTGLLGLDKPRSDPGDIVDCKQRVGNPES
jgi:hypothetical protein